MTSAGPIAPLARALGEEAQAVAGVPVAVELVPPAQAEHGDLATPVALSLARHAKRAPRDIAEELRGRLLARGDAHVVESAEVAGPGFLNLVLSPAWFADAAAAIAADEGFGGGTAAVPERVLLEFVSANPTGRLHVGHARQAAYGDSLARILRFAGHAVEREYYVNDYGRQMELFGLSVAARYGQLCGLATQVPEDGYRGDDVASVAERLHAELGDSLRDRVDPPTPEALEVFRTRGCDLMMGEIRDDLAAFRVGFDRYFSETSLHDSGAVVAGVAALERAGDAYREDDALWFRATRYGDEKDRVLVRSDGLTTYLASDVAYHLDKAGRGDHRLIDVLGADHHGYVARLKAVLAAGGYDPERLEVAILQLVSLVERGEAKRMSKRAGTAVTLRDLVGDIGVDAARFFLVERSHETAFDLDLDLAREQSQENPVYYVQYAHARIAGILAQVGDEPVDRPGPPAALDPSERAVVLRLCGWPDAVRDAADRRAPHRVVAYLKDLSADFHTFYHRCRVAGEEPAVQAFRLDVCRAVAAVVRRGLGLLGVDAPDRM
ncbi:MAG: arginine--tRNA ligase [Actinomycetota bacterium]